MTNFFLGGRLGNCGALAVGVLRFAQDDRAFLTNAREVGRRAVGIGSQRPRCNGLALSKAGVRARLPLIAKNAKSGERNGKSSNWLRWRLLRGPLLEMREKWGTHCSGVFARSKAWARGRVEGEARGAIGTPAHFSKCARSGAPVVLVCP
jgi:hypothetical protein